MCELDRCRRALGPVARLGTGAEQHQHRPQALAAGRKRRPGLRPEPAAVAPDEGGEALLDRRHAANSQSSAASRTMVTGVGRLIGSYASAPPAQAGRVPKWIAMMPPASTV